MTTPLPHVQRDLEEGFTLLRQAPSLLRLKHLKAYQYAVKAEDFPDETKVIDLDRFNEAQLYRAITRIYSSVSALYNAFPDKMMRSMIVAACLAEDHFFERDVAGPPFSFIHS